MISIETASFLQFLGCWLCGHSLRYHLHCAAYQWAQHLESGYSALFVSCIFIGLATALVANDKKRKKRKRTKKEKKKKKVKEKRSIWLSSSRQSNITRKWWPWGSRPHCRYCHKKSMMLWPSLGFFFLWNEGPRGWCYLPWVFSDQLI